jgi:hypothetical protein
MHPEDGRSRYAGILDVYRIVDVLFCASNTTD